MYTVLIVDDDRKTREGLARFIEWQSFGFQNVLLAKDGKEAYDIYHTDKPDLVVSDIKMPKLDGVKLLKCLRNDGEDVPFIFLTAYTEVEFLKNAVTYNAYEYVNKPIRLTEFKDIVLKVKKDLDESRKQQYEKKELKTEVYQQKLALQKERFERMLMNTAVTSQPHEFKGQHSQFYLCVFSILGKQSWIEIQMFLEKNIKSDFIHVEDENYHILLVENENRLTLGSLKKTHRRFEQKMDSFIFAGCYYVDPKHHDFNLALKQTISLFYESYNKSERLVYFEDVQSYSLAHEIQSEIYKQVGNVNLTIQSLSEECGISVQHLIRVYKEEYGLTPNQALIKIRISKSKALLLYTNYRVQEIAYQCGFKDPNYFGKVFRKETGMSPLEFRESYDEKI